MHKVNISIPLPLLQQAIDKLPFKEKYKLADKLEKDLLSEFDEYDNSNEVKERIKLSMEEYKKGKYTLK